MLFSIALQLLHCLCRQQQRCRHMRPSIALQHHKASAFPAGSISQQSCNPLDPQCPQANQPCPCLCQLMSIGKCSQVMRLACNCSASTSVVLSLSVQADVNRKVFTGNETCMQLFCNKNPCIVPVCASSCNRKMFTGKPLHAP